MDACMYIDGQPVSSYTEYKRAVQVRSEFDEEKPYAAVVLLADSQLMFWKEEGLWWVNRVKCELPSRALEYDGGEAAIKASYVGVANGDLPEFFELFEAAMELIGITDCKHIHHPPTDAERAHLEQSDVVLLAGGDIQKATTAFTDYIGEAIKWRYYDGAVVIGVGTSATLLGTTAWKHTTPTAYDTFKGLGLIPVMVGHAAEVPTVVKQTGYGSVALGLHKGGGVLFNTDGTFEPVKEIITEVHYPYTEDRVTTTMVAPPEKGEGILVAVKKLAARMETAKAKKGTGANNSTEREVAPSVEEAEMEVGAVHITRAEGIRNLGNDAFKQEDFKEALKLYRSALLIDRTNVKTALNISFTLLKMQNLPDALKAAHHAMSLSCGKSAKAWYRRATVLLAMGNTHHAKLDLMEASALAPLDSTVKDLLENVNERIEENKGSKSELLKPTTNGVLEVVDDMGLQLSTIEAEEEWKALETVRVTGCWLREHGCKVLLSAMRLSDVLVEVDLRNNAIGDAGVRELMGAGVFGSLEKLNLSFNNITDSALPVFTPDLVKHLDLSGNRLTFAAAAHFCPQTRHPTALTHLSLSHQHPPLRHDSLWRLFPPPASNLQELGLYGTPVDTPTAHRLKMRLRETNCLIMVGSDTAPDQHAPMY